LKNLSFKNNSKKLEIGLCVQASQDSDNSILSTGRRELGSLDSHSSMSNIGRTKRKEMTNHDENNDDMPPAKQQA